jgi:hypothetical protein
MLHSRRQENFVAEFEVRCPECGATYQCKGEQNGKLLHCDCGHFLIARDPNAPPEPEPDLDPTPPPMKAKPVPEPPRPIEPVNFEPEKPPVIGVKSPSVLFPPRDSPVIGVKKPGPSPVPPPDNPVIEVKKFPPSVVIPPPDNLVIGVKKTEPVVAPPPEANPTVVEEPPKQKPKPKIVLTPELKMKAIAAGVGAVLLLLLLPALFRRSTKVDPMPDSTYSTTSTATPNAAATDCSGNPVRLENGTPVAHSLLGNGMGKLEVENLTPTDVAVRLVGNDDLTVAWVYVQQGQRTSIDNIPLGTHRLIYEAGSDWDGQNLLFRCNPTYLEFDRTMDFKERQEDNRTSYSDYRVTLGKSRATSISKEEFLRGHIGRQG